jgi:hypothetical protein
MVKNIDLKSNPPLSGEFDAGKRPDEIFYKRMGDPLWYCRYCGHGHTESEMRDMALAYIQGVSTMRELLESSRFAGK